MMESNSCFEILSIENLTMKRIRQIVAKVYEREPVKVAVHAILLDMAGSRAAAAMLEQAIVWNHVAGGAWWYKSKAEWYEEARLSRHEVDSSEKKLAALVSKEVRQAEGGSPLSWYRTQSARVWAALAAALGKSLEEIAFIVHEIVLTEAATDGAEIGAADTCGNSTGTPAENQQVDMLKIDMCTCGNSTGTPAENQQIHTSVFNASDSSSEQASEAAAAAGARAREDETAAAAYNTAQGEKLSDEEQANMNGHGGRKSEIPLPPVAGGPPPGVKESDYWRAFARAWDGIEPDFPNMLTGEYQQAVKLLERATATADEIEALTRHKLAGKQVYRFTWLPVDLPEWRRRTRAAAGGMHNSGKYAAYFDDGSGIENAAVARGAAGRETTSQAAQA